MNKELFDINRLNGQEINADVVRELESKMLQQTQVECSVVHRFGPGIYIRELSIPAGTMAVGHHQNFEHTNIMLKGRVTMFHDDGTSTEFIAPAFYIGKPGRKIGYVHEDMVWQNIYPTDETDVETLEETYLTKSDEWVDDNNIRGKALELSCASDNDDYNKMLSETGYTEDIVRAQSENTDDIIKLPFSGYKIMVSDSPIEGKGLFATSDIDEDEVIAPARINGNRTIAGRYTNHAKFPNAEMVLLPDGDFNLVSINSIKGCLGGQKGDEITIDYRQALELKVQSCQA